MGIESFPCNNEELLRHPMLASGLVCRHRASDKQRSGLRLKQLSGKLGGSAVCAAVELICEVEYAWSCDGRRGGLRNGAGKSGSAAAAGLGGCKLSQCCE